MTQDYHSAGLGCADYQLAVSIGNKPKLPEYQNLNLILPLGTGEITSIGQQCGNGWRKVFNIYAKLMFSLAEANVNLGLELVGDCKSWQEYRDAKLLQSESQTALIFGAPFQTTTISVTSPIHIICGKTHALNLIDAELVDKQFRWLDSEFAVNVFSRSVICPYFDYRQLSNIKIDRLIGLIHGL